MEQKINIVSNDSIANELNIANLAGLLNTLGIDAKAQKQAGQITLQVTYTGEQISKLKKRNAGRKRKLTENLTYGDVEQLLETTSVILFVHFFFFISMKKEKAEPKKKNTND